MAHYRQTARDDAPKPGGNAVATERRLGAFESISEIHFSPEHHATLLGHALRKLQGEHRSGETAERKAFGLVAARIDGCRAEVARVIPVARNLRAEPTYKQGMDDLAIELAVPSETPLTRRGWVADPKEILEAHRLCDEEGSLVFGSYHMHRVGWPTDPLRDTPTELDEALARDCGMWMLILSMVDPSQPILRAFFEGDRAKEARVCL